MPGMDGEKLVNHIRSDSRHDDLRIIMLTSIDQALSAEQREELQIHASITKPLRRSRLFDAINETLGRPQADPSSVAATPVTDLAAQSIAAARNQSAKTIAPAVTEADIISKASDGPVTTTGRLLNILIVEDNPVNQMVIDELLQEFGHTTVLAENGKQALGARCGWRY